MPILAIFIGQTELTTSHPSAAGPFRNDVTLDLVISGDRSAITITDFPPIKTQPFDTPVGENTTTVTRIGGGTGRYDVGGTPGHIAMPIQLHFDHSLEVAGDSDLSLELSTDPPGSPVTPEPFGQVSLVGSGQFVEGFLGGETGNLKVAGTISPADDCATGGPYAATTFGTFKGPGESMQIVDGDVTLDKVADRFRLHLTSLHGSITLKQKVDQKSSAHLTACAKVTVGGKDRSEIRSRYSRESRHHDRAKGRSGVFCGH